MPDGFSDLIETSNAFFTELAQNNTRDWFEARKADYVSQIKKPSELMADLLAEDLSRMTGVSLAPKVFRIYRDVRFSKDKTPYNTHLHIMWDRDGSPAWFFGSAPGYIMLAAGSGGYKGAKLAAYRAWVDKNGDTIQSVIDTARDGLGASLSDFGSAPLKRVPKPYDADHPHAELLKRKSLILSAPPEPGWQDGGLLPALLATARGLMPFWQTLNDANLRGKV